ncbi:MAG: AI-2E family transporter, partial [Candidatus Woesearchaeota archaeon]
ALFFGALLAYVFYPIHRWATKKINKNISALLICLIVILIIIIPAVMLVNIVVRDSYSLYTGSKELLSNGITFDNCQSHLCNLAKELSENPEVKYQSQEVLKAVTSLVIKKGTEFLVGVPKFLLNLFVMFMALFFFLRDGDKFIKKLSIYLNLQKPKYHQIMARTKEVIHAIVYGYGLVALIQGALGALGFWAFGVSSPFFWGIVMAVLSFIPFLGTGLIWVPAAAIIFFKGMFTDSSALMYKGGGLFLYGLVVIGSLDNLIRPKIVGDRAKIHPAIIILGIFGGIALLGSIGLIVGPLVLSVTAIIIEAYLNNE